MELQLKIALILLFTGFLHSCSDVESSTHRALVVVDISGSDVEGIPSEEKVKNDLFKLFEFDESTTFNDGYEIGITLLDDLSGASIAWSKIKAAQGSSAMVNPKKRERITEKFFESLDGNIQRKLSEKELGTGQSKIYAKICKSLKNFLAKDADNYYLILYSDLLENSELASFYKEEEINKAAADPMGFYNEKMKPLCELPDMSQVLVHIYPYRTPGSDVFINKAEQFWVSLFSEHGAEVVVDP